MLIFLRSHTALWSVRKHGECLSQHITLVSNVAGEQPVIWVPEKQPPGAGKLLGYPLFCLEPAAISLKNNS